MGGANKLVCVKDCMGAEGGRLRWIRQVDRVYDRHVEPLLRMERVRRTYKSMQSWS